MCSICAGWGARTLWGGGRQIGVAAGAPLSSLVKTYELVAYYSSGGVCGESREYLIAAAEW